MELKELSSVVFEYQNTIREIDDLENMINDLTRQANVLQQYRDVACKKRDTLNNVLMGLAK